MSKGVEIISYVTLNFEEVEVMKNLDYVEISYLFFIYFRNEFILYTCERSAFSINRKAAIVSPSVSDT